MSTVQMYLLIPTPKVQHFRPERDLAILFDKGDKSLERIRLAVVHQHTLRRFEIGIPLYKATRDEQRFGNAVGELYPDLIKIVPGTPRIAMWTRKGGVLSRDLYKLLATFQPITLEHVW